MRPSIDLWGKLLTYNAINDPTYNKNIHFWNAAEQESIVGLKQPSDRGQSFATYSYNFGPKGGSGATIPKVRYTPGVTSQAPAEIINATPFAEKIIAADGASFVPAIIQSGGNVAINATNKITNGVERSFTTTAAGASRSTNTQVAGTGNTTVINLNRQLPPDLAQQQVNPVTLRGFSLPTGKNGLFRLSEDGASAQPTGQGHSGAQSWTMGGADIDLAQRQKALPESQGRTLQLDGAAQVAADTHQVVVAAREANGINVQARTVDASVVGNADAGIVLPGRTSGTDITRVDGISAGNTTGAPAVGGLNTADRDPRNLVTAPGSLPSLNVPGVSSAERDTRVGANQSGGLNLPDLTPLASAALVSSGASGQTLNRVQGLPGSKAVSQPHKYLIETNPVLTDLKQFMSSDYLLAGLGYNPDESAKRLGDGLYEQRLIQQAIVERTGQRFIDGQTSDEAVFRYLMDNAIRSKQTLDLSVGVSLTGQQVAALTHDIVWLEEHEVNGEKVLVPVVYLAQAENRLAPNGALIAGQDVSLIAGKNLENAGTLRASNNLSAVAGNDLVNSGLIEAGKRVDLLAGNNIVNKAGGIIAGRDVSMTAVNGDVINERSITSAGYNIGFSKNTDYIDSAARIEAANDLGIRAGRDVTSAGGVLQSGNDTTIVAGRDVNLVSAQQHDTMNGGKRNRAEEVTQNGSSVEAGRDLKVSAGRDFTAIASEIDAKRDVAMSAAGDMYFASGADEQHSYSKTSSTKRQEDHVSQVATTVAAGRDVTLSAGKDLALIASRISAGDEAYLVAGNNLGLLSAEDSDYSLYDMKRGGGFGSGKTQRDEVTKVKNIGSEIKTGGDLTIQSLGDQKYQVAKLESGEDLAIVSGGAVTFEGMKDLHQESHEKSKSSFAWTSAKGQGNTDETLRQSVLIAKGDMTIKAVDGLKIDIKHIDQKTVSQTIDAMVQADPQLAWLKDAEKRGDVDWRQVKEIHDSFKYSNSGLGVGAQLVIAIVMAYFVGPMAMDALTAAGASTAVAAGGAAVATSAATNATVSFVNNRGDLGAVIKDTTSNDALKGYVVNGLTSGLAVGVFGDLTGTQVDPLTGKIKIDLTTINGIGRFAATQILQNGTSTALSKVLGMDASFGGALTTSLLNTVAAASFDAVGGQRMVDGSADKIAVHALIGGLLAQASGSSFLAGAVAAGANEALATQLRRTVTQLDPQQRDLLLTSASQLVGLLSAALAGGDAEALETGAWIAKNATQYNFLNHYEMVDFVGDMNACAGSDICYRNTWTAQYGNTNYSQLSQDNLKDALGTVGPARANALLGEIHGGLAALGELQCTSPVCDTYKFTLIDRALTARAELQKVYAEGPGIIGGILLGPIGAVGGSVRGSSTAAEASGIEKAYAYWAGVREAKNIPTIAKGFVPAERTGLEFEIKSVSGAEGHISVELSARQKFDSSGKAVSSNYAQSDLLARYSPEGELYIDWYGTTVTGRGVGSEMVSRAIETVGPGNVKSVAAQLGHTNLEAFRAATASGLTREQAIWLTPLGKTMNALGFTKAEISGAGSGVRFLP